MHFGSAKEDILNNFIEFGELSGEFENFDLSLEESSDLHQTSDFKLSNEELKQDFNSDLNLEISPNLRQEFKKSAKAFEKNKNKENDLFSPEKKYEETVLDKLINMLAKLLSKLDQKLSKLLGKKIKAKKAESDPQLLQKNHKIKKDKRKSNPDSDRIDPDLNQEILNENESENFD